MVTSNYFKPLIWIEGNIGSGKSTLTRIIENRLGFRGFYEPVDTNPYLKMFYEDPKRWAFPMQIHLLQRRYAIQQQSAWEAISHSSEYNGSVIDRGIPGDRVFAKIHTDDGNIHPLEWQTYEEFYATMVHSLRPPSLMIYLDVPPRECYFRARKRARDQESVVEDQEFLDYLFKLETYYRELLDQLRSGGHAWSSGIEIIEVDWQDDLNEEGIQKVLDLIKKKFNIPDGQSADISTSSLFTQKFDPEG